MQSPTKPFALDRIAIALSGLCLLHCLSIPFALLLGPTLGTWLLNTETSTHWLLLAFAAPISMWALHQGFAKHRSVLTLAMGYAGLVFMLLGALHTFGETTETWLTVIGVVVLMAAHIRNTLASVRGVPHESSV